jgi:hypothetical protein
LEIVVSDIPGDAAPDHNEIEMLEAKPNFAHIFH